MTHITDIILITAIEDGSELGDSNPSTDKLSAYLEKNHNGSLIKVDGYAGGGKAM